MKKWFLGAFVLLLPTVVQAEISYDQLVQLLLQPEVLEGSFSQEKYLGALDTTLISTGVFTYYRGKSIRWEILQPIQSELMITPAAVSSKQGNQELIHQDMNNNPVARVIGEIFFAVLTVDSAKLAPYFELSGSIEEQQWHAILLPLD